MEKKDIDKILALTSELLKQYWSMEYEELLHYCNDTVLWIGPEAGEYAEEKYTLSKIFYQIQKKKESNAVLFQKYELVFNRDNVCMIAGKYLVLNDEKMQNLSHIWLDADRFDQLMQRCSIMWTKVNGAFRIKQVHLSEPVVKTGFERQMKPLTIPERLMKKYFCYQKENLDHFHMVHQFELVGKKRAVCFLQNLEILYVAAAGKFSILHLVDGTEVKIDSSLGKFMEQCGSDYLQVHRSYSINPQYVQIVETGRIQMMDGSVIPVAVKKNKEISDALVAFYKRKNQDVMSRWLKDEERGSA